MSSFNELSPYINTVNTTTVFLNPRDLRNDLYNSLKRNLRVREEKNYVFDVGYIVKIFKVLDYKSSPMRLENTNASTPFKVKYSCRLCAPRKKHQIICKVNQINKMFILMKNGPILAFSTYTRISENFFVDNDDNIHYKINDVESKILQVNDYVKINIDSIRYTPGQNVISVIAIIENIASDAEIELYAKDQHDYTGESVELEDYKQGKLDIDKEIEGDVKEEEIVTDEPVEPTEDSQEGGKSKKIKKTK